MPRQRAVSAVNQFIGGFNTEANPLGFPENSSLDEQNCELLPNGSRSRRNGFDFEPDYSVIETTIEYSPDDRVASKQFLWKNPGNIPSKEFLVVQVGNYISIHDTHQDTTSQSQLYEKYFTNVDHQTFFGITDIDGTLIIANGSDRIATIEYDGTNFSYSEDRLYIRDFFGVEVPGLTETANVQLRPQNLVDGHLYNLRNQTFALPRVDGRNNNLNMKDPIKFFYDEYLTDSNEDESNHDVHVVPGLLEEDEEEEDLDVYTPSVQRYPSNADNMTQFIVSDPNKDSGRLVERFDPVSMVKSPPNNSRAPQGYFIIDALSRGASRRSEESRLFAQNPLLELKVNTLPEDRTPGGAQVVEKYAGRVWFAGFTGEVEDGDKKSPHLTSYVLFSQAVQDPSQIFLCYQAADPTSHIDPDLVATDGGFIKIDGAYGINSMITFESSLFVFAANGVWRIAGKDDNTFSADSYSVYKITDKGCFTPNSVVFTGQSIVYWSEFEIIAVARNQLGDWEAVDITESRIETYYESIPSENKYLASGYYNNSDDTIRWMFNGTDDDGDYSEELIFNIKFNSFTKNRVYLPDGVVSIVSSESVLVNKTSYTNVTVGGEVVTVNNENVTTYSTSYLEDYNRKFYCILTESDYNIAFSFGDYSNTEDSYDWKSVSATDVPAYIITGPISSPQAMYIKDVPYVTSYFERTEGGDVDSSCYLQAQWDWTSNANTNKWSTARQIYRPKRINSGDAIVKTRSRVRGFGNAVSFKFSSEEGKTFKLYGWEHNIDTATQE